jgi:hypothetical protein
MAEDRQRAKAPDQGTLGTWLDERCLRPFPDHRVDEGRSLAEPSSDATRE